MPNAQLYTGRRAAADTTAISHTTQPLVELVERSRVQIPELDSTSRTDTSSLSRVVRDGGDLCSVPLSG